LISITINLARKIDAALHSNLSKSDLDAWLSHYNILSMIDRVKAETKQVKQEASIRRLFLSEAPLLYDAYRQHYGSPA
jgi:hypothetical protein